jgi:hypothetical protein
MNSLTYAQTGIELLKLSEACAADTKLSILLSDTASTVFERASHLARRSQQDESIEQSSPVEMPPLEEEIRAGEWRTLTIDQNVSDTKQVEPSYSVAPSRVTTVGSGPNKFQEWVREMKLPAGAKFAILKAGRPEKEFRLSFNRQGKALLTTSFADGTVIQGSSPSAVYKLYIKKMTGKDCGQVDAWKKVYLQAPASAGGSWQPIGNPNWLLVENDWNN